MTSLAALAAEEQEERRMIREPKWWRVDGDDLEKITASDLSEAVEQWADDMAPSTIPADGVAIGYAPKVVSPRDVGDILDSVIEALDEEYGDPDGEAESVSQAGMIALREAEAAFFAAVIAHYVPYQCDEVIRVPFKTVDHVPADWPVEGREPSPVTP